MFATALADAIANAPFDHLTDLSSKLWKAFKAGEIAETQAAALSEAIEARKPKRGAEPSNFKLPTAAVKKQRSPDKQASIERRRRLARQSPVPPELVHEFTTCEHATMTVLVGEIQTHGVCAKFMDAIAALAGTCRTIVRNTLNKARKFNLLQREERRRRGQKSLTNLVRIVNPVWQRWLTFIGRRKMRTTTETDSRIANSGDVEGFGGHFSTGRGEVRGSKKTE